MEIAIIGAGVVGLSTALSIQEAFPQAKLTLFADKFNEKTLSSGAGGFFCPDIGVHHDAELVRKWCKDSFSHFLHILQSPEASEAGMQLVSGYRLSSSISPQNNLLQELVPEYRQLNENELQLFPEHFKNGVFFTTIITDCRYYLPWMKAKFEKGGGIVVKEHISSICKIPNNFSVIINCAGLASKQLIQDEKLIPIRGQTIKVKAPWIKNFYCAEGIYIFPGVDYITLGGIEDYGCWNTNVRQDQKQFIWDKCTELVPSLKKAEFVWDWVELRPYRPSVRVDASFVNCNGSYRMMVNNYGHGGHGVTLSWGTAQEVTKILKRLLTKKDFTISKL